MSCDRRPLSWGEVQWRSVLIQLRPFACSKLQTEQEAEVEQEPVLPEVVEAQLVRG